MRATSLAHRLLPFAVLGTVGVAVPAIAQPSGAASTPALSTYPTCATTPTKDDSEVAHGAYIAGKRAFDESDYPTAIQYFKDALRRDCTKYQLLDIISRSYELKGDKPEAVNALENYLKRAPANDPSNEAIQKRLAALKAQAAAEASAKAAAASASASTTSPTATAPPTATAAPASTATESDPNPPRGHSVAPWVLVGTGGAFIVTGVVLLVVGENDISTAGEACGAPPGSSTCAPNGDKQAAQDQQSRGNTLAAVGGVVGGLGVVGVVGGLVWHFTEDTGPAKTTAGKVDIHPDARPGFAGLSIRGTF